MKHKIFLWGMMGSGKSSLGKSIANAIKLPYIDLDDEIELAANLTIVQIFEKFGESKFRVIEADVLRELSSKNDAFLMSCGGGTPCFHDNAIFMNSIGKSFYLEVTIPTLVKRIVMDEQNRPLLSDLNTEEIESTLVDLLEERSPFYDLAHLKVRLSEDYNEDLDAIINIIRSEIS